MPTQTEITNMAVFCDFENVALGVRDARYAKFDIGKVLERLLLKGNIVVRKAYCDWERYKEFKRSMHEASFELIEIPHVRQSGKNSADIRMVVDALDLCYTKAHLDTFVLLNGDSDFSPLVAKLRENAKTVIGVGVKQSTSDLLINICDEFIYYDDLVRKEASRAPRKPKAATPANGAEKPPAEPEEKQTQTGVPKKLDPSEALEKLRETVEALAEERGEGYALNNSMIKEALKRRDPGFNERAYGFKMFSQLLAEAAKRGLVRLEPNEKSGGYLVRPKE